MIGIISNHLWQSTLFALAAGLLTLAFRNNRAQIRYWLWFSASLKFLIPLVVFTSLGSHVRLAPAARRIATPAVSAAIVQVAEPFAEASTASFRVSTAPKPDRHWLIPALWIAWVIGFLAIVLSRLLLWRRVRVVVRQSRPFTVPGIEIPLAVDLRCAPGLLEPGVVGWLRPILLLPGDIAQRLTPRELEAVLAHELCHIRRRDNLTSAIHMIVEAVFWFYPPVWWIGSRLVDERERACDEEVLRLGNEPLVYAEGILNVCKAYLESPLRCVSGVTGSNLKKRVQAIITGPAAADLNFAKKAALAAAALWAVAIPVLVSVIHASSFQTLTRPADTPKWEVVSIKPCPAFNPGVRGAQPGGQRAGGAPSVSSPGTLNLNCGPIGNTLDQLITQAYLTYADGQHVSRFRTVSVEGGPAWVKSERYEIRAKADGALPPEIMMRGPMMQALLEDRFKLKIHAETRDVPVYALIVLKTGIKAQKVEDGSCEELDPFLGARGRPIRLTPDSFEEHLQPGQKPACGMSAISSWGAEDKNETIHGQAMGFTQLASTLSRGLDRPVIDRTGVSGMFTFHLKFAKDQATAGFLPPLRPGAVPLPVSPEVAAEPAGPSLFTAIQEQLGLKLEPARGPGEFLVIDSVEKPSEN